MNKRPQIVEESPFGLYVWQMPDGAWVADDERNFLNISSKKGDLKRIAELTAAARSFGINEGGPVFLSGHTQVSDEEYERQKAAMQDGYVPDPYDLPSMIEDMKRNG